jgi:hypothetical protein
MITSNNATGASAEKRSEHTAIKRSPWPFARAFSIAVKTACGFMSRAVMCAAPGRAAGETEDP